MRMLKVVETEMYVDRAPLAFADTLGIGCACVHVSAPCVDQVAPVIGPSTTEHRYVQKRLSFYAVSRVAH
jgi:hypothetical protein